MTNLSIAVIGGGIGGLVAALSLLQAGHDVHVYEQASGLSEVGAGIQISPNASKVLHALGLAAPLAAAGVRPLAWHQRRWDDGRTLIRTPLAGAMEDAFGAPHTQIHRADLLRALHAALPDGRLHTGRALVRITDHGDRIEARFKNGDRIEADILIGADGIHSATRAQLFGPARPNFIGSACYRGLAPAAAVAHLDIPLEAQVWMGPGRHFVHYFVRGGDLLNFVAVVDQDAWTAESWTDPADIHEARAHFADWHPQIRGILNAVEDTFIWALFDRAPLPAWSSGRATLLGDACHPMAPFMAQGAAQAIEDGATLAACLGATDDPIAALKTYEALRLPRTARVQALAADNKTRFHLPDGPAQIARDADMARNVTDWSLDNVAWLYGHDAARPDGLGSRG